MATDYAALKKGGFMKQKQKNTFSRKQAKKEFNSAADRRNFLKKKLEEELDGTRV